MAPSPHRRRRRALSRTVRALISVAFLVGLAYIIHRPLAHLYWGTYARLRASNGASRLFGGSAAPTITQWLAAQRQQTEDRILAANSSSAAALAAASQASHSASDLLLFSDKLQQNAQEAAMQAGAVAQPIKAAAATGCLPTKWTGSPADYRLREEAVKCLVDEHNTVMVTWANHHYLDFVMTWVEHVKSVGVTAYMVGAMDDTLLQKLASSGVNTFSMNSGLTEADFGWGSTNFHKMGREKINLIYTFTKMGHAILVSDVDTVWMRNPLPYMARYPEADCLTSSDHLSETASDGGLEHYPEAGSAANIGIMLVKPAANPMVKEWVDKIVADPNYWDQNAFNDLMTRGVKFEPKREDRLFLGYDGKYKFGILPVSTFCSGHTFFTQRMPWKLGLEPYVVHATFQFSGTPGKRHRMREFKLWHDPPEYYDRPGGFLAFTPDVPQAMLDAAPPLAGAASLTLNGTVGHFDLVHHQLRQVRSAWAISQSLGRALILPPIWAGLDRWWAPHDGKIPGSHLDLPYLAPFDHVMDLEGMVVPRAEEEFGPTIEFREYSFLDNPRLPAAVNASRLRVGICAPNDASGSCADGHVGGTEVDGTVQLQPGLNDAQLKTTLQGFADRKVLHFDTMLGAFGGFVVPRDAEVFQNRLKLYSTIWCCVNQHPGHIFYDIFSDVWPRTDRFNRAWTDEWKPVCGP